MADDSSTPPLLANIPSALSAVPLSRVVGKQEMSRMTEQANDRTRKEAQLHENIALRRSEQQRRDTAALKNAKKKQELEQQKKDQHRKAVREREEEILERSSKEKKMLQFLEEQKRTQKVKTINKKQYMRELQDMGAMMALQRKKETERKKNVDMAHRKAEMDYSNMRHEVERKERASFEAIERDSREHKAVVVEEAHGKKYQLESVQRSRTRELDTQYALERQQAKRGTPSEQQRKLWSAEQTLKIKKRAFEKEIAEKQKAIDQEEQAKKRSIDEQAQIQKTKAEHEYRQAMQLADRWYSNRLNEIAFPAQGSTKAA